MLLIPEDKVHYFSTHTSFQFKESKEDFWSFVCADDDGTKCATALKDFNKVVAEMGPLIKAGQFNASIEKGAEIARSYGVSPESLTASPCKLDIVLAGFDEKGDTEEWPHFSGVLPTANQASSIGCSSHLGSFRDHCSSPLNLHFASPGEMKSKDMQKFAMEAFPSFVTRISAATMQTFLGPDPSVPCVILFTDKESTPPVFAALSVNLRKYRYKFADAHSSDTALMSQFNIKKVSLFGSPTDSLQWFLFNSSLKHLLCSTDASTQQKRHCHVCETE